VLNVIKEQKDAALLVRLVGSIEEGVQFEQLLGNVPAELIVNCKEVPRINSVGVKAWIRYFQSLQTKGVRLRFVECSSAIIEQVNLISNFVPADSVESFFVPFACTKCKSELLGLYSSAAIKKLQGNVPAQTCPKCGGSAEFDDIPEEYFGFLTR